MTTAGERSIPSFGDERRKLLTGCAYALTVIVGFTVLLVSGNYLHEYALATGMTGWLAWTLVVALEAGGAGGTLGWFSGASAAVTLGRRIALANLAASVLGNIVGHLLGTGSVHASAALVVLTGAVYPAELWAMAHLALVLRTDRRDQPVAAERGAGLAPPPENAPPVAIARPAAQPHPRQPELAPFTSSRQPASPPAPARQLASPAHQPPAGVASASPRQAPALASHQPSPVTSAGDATSASPQARARQLAAVRELVKQGKGRQAIASHLAISPHQARQLIASVASDTRPSPARPLRAVGGVTR